MSQVTSMSWVFNRCALGGKPGTMTLPVQVEVDKSDLGTLQGLLIVRVCKGSKVVDFLSWIGIIFILPLSLSLNRCVFLDNVVIKGCQNAVLN